LPSNDNIFKKKKGRSTSSISQRYESKENKKNSIEEFSHQSSEKDLFSNLIQAKESI